MKKTLFKGIITCLFISLATFASASQNITGNVLETMDSGGYTYMNVDTGDRQSWVAIPQSQVKVGQEVTYKPGMVMNNFASKTLNRTFDSIVFSSGIDGGSAASHGKGMGMGGMQNPHGQKVVADKDDSFASAVQAEGGASAASIEPAAGSGGSLGAMTPFSGISVDKAAGDNAYRVSEIFAQAEALNGKTIRIQGKVVKYSPSIMGRNWVHLQDGTGDPEAGTHDLVLTTSEQIKVNTVLTMEGVLAANKDFGAGYKYVAIVEEAKAVQ